MLDLNGKHKETAFCVDCNEDVKYRILVGGSRFMRNGIEYAYNEFTAVCPICGRDLNVPWVDEYNIKTREQLVRDTERVRGKKNADG